jgi:hypothetical protein
VVLSVRRQSETDVGEQNQGVTDVADGKLFHGLGLLFGKSIEL